MDGCVVPRGDAFANFVEHGRNVGVRSMKDDDDVIVEHLPMRVGFGYVTTKRYLVSGVID